MYCTGLCCCGVEALLLGDSCDPMVEEWAVARPQGQGGPIMPPAAAKAIPAADSPLREPPMPPEPPPTLPPMPPPTTRSSSEYQKGFVTLGVFSVGELRLSEVSDEDILMLEVPTERREL